MPEHRRLVGCTNGRQKFARTDMLTQFNIYLVVDEAFLVCYLSITGAGKGRQDVGRSGTLAIRIFGALSIPEFEAKQWEYRVVAVTLNGEYLNEHLVPGFVAEALDRISGTCGECGTPTSCRSCAIWRLQQQLAQLVDESRSRPVDLGARVGSGRLEAPRRIERAEVRLELVEGSLANRGHPVPESGAARSVSNASPGCRWEGWGA